MNYRLLLHRLAVAVAIGMVVAALAHPGVAHSRSSSNPPVPEFNQGNQDEQRDKKGEKKTQAAQQHLPLLEPTDPSARLLQQERLERLQWRL